MQFTLRTAARRARRVMLAFALLLARQYRGFSHTKIAPESVLAMYHLPAGASNKAPGSQRQPGADEENEVWRESDQASPQNTVN